MDNNRENIAFVEKYAKIYCKRLGLDYDDVIFLYTVPDFIWFATKIDDYKNPPVLGYYGQTWKQYDVIFIHLYEHDDRRELKDTIAHELIHLKYKQLDHGRKFTLLVKKVLRGKN